MSPSISEWLCAIRCNVKQNFFHVYFLWWHSIQFSTFKSEKSLTAFCRLLLKSKPRPRRCISFRNFHLSSKTRWGMAQNTTTSHILDSGYRLILNTMEFRDYCWSATEPGRSVVVRSGFKSILLYRVIEAITLCWIFAHTIIRGAAPGQVTHANTFAWHNRLFSMPPIRFSSPPATAADVVFCDQHRLNYVAKFRFSCQVKCAQVLLHFRLYSKIVVSHTARKLTNFTLHCTIHVSGQLLLFNSRTTMWKS